MNDRETTERETEKGETTAIKPRSTKEIKEYSIGDLSSLIGHVLLGSILVLVGIAFFILMFKILTGAIWNSLK